MVVCFVTKTSLELKEIIKMRHCTRPPLDYSPTLLCSFSFSCRLDSIKASGVALI